jgi:Histidine kinase-like ATPase domain
MDADGIADVQLAVTEAATNAVIHAYADATGELTVTAAMQAGELEIVIADTGPGLVDRDDGPGLGVGLSDAGTPNGGLARDRQRRRGALHGRPPTRSPRERRAPLRPREAPARNSAGCRSHADCRTSQR